MDIVQRNLFRLLRSGAFVASEEIEPMSAYKWGRLYQSAVMHDVVPYAYAGLQRCRHQFFVHITDSQEAEWRKAVAACEARQKSQEAQLPPEEDELLRPDRLTNPLLNHRLQEILDEEHSAIAARRLLLRQIRIVRHLLNEGVPVRHLLELGLTLRKDGSQIDFAAYNQWMKRLRLSQMGDLTGELLIQLFGFEDKEIPFLAHRQAKSVTRIAKELIEFANTHSGDFYFSQQDGQLFVHGSNSSAAFNHIRRSARYFRYYPSESVTNFFASFVHSLSHIEE